MSQEYIKKPVTNSEENERSSLAFSEAKRYFDYLSDANKQLDDKFTALFASISIILTFFSLFFMQNSDGISQLSFILLITLLFSFLIFCIVTILGLFPKNVPYPYDGTYEAYQNIFVTKPDLSDVYDQIAVNYEENLNVIKCLNKNKSDKLKWAFLLFSFTIVLMIVLIFVPLIS